MEKTQWDVGLEIHRDKAELYPDGHVMVTQRRMESGLEALKEAIDVAYNCPWDGVDEPDISVVLRDGEIWWRECEN